MKTDEREEGRNHSLNCDQDQGRMGADAKRKESRKRKFGAQMTELQSDSTMGLGSEKVEIEEPAKKKIKRVSQSLLDVNIDPAAEGDEGDEAGEIQIVSDSAEQDGEQAVVTQKTQRFIVFIGMSSLCYIQCCVCDLTSFFDSLREPAIHSYG